MAKIYDKDLDKDSKIDWGGDARPESEGGTGGLPVSGRVVQKFIKDNLDDLKDKVNGVPADPEHQTPAVPGLVDRMDDAEDAIDDLQQTVGEEAKPAVYYTQEEADAYNEEHGLQPGDPDYKTTESIKIPAIPATGLVGRMDSAEDRLDDIDGEGQNTLVSRMNSVEDRLDDIDGEGQNTLVSRVDTIEENLNGEGGVDDRLDAIEDRIDGDNGIEDRLDSVESDIDDIEQTLSNIDVQKLEQIAESFDPDELNAQLNYLNTKKAGFFFSDSDTNQVLVFQDEATALDWAAEEPRDYDSQLILGKFSAPADFECIVTILGLNGATTKYIQYGEKGQNVRATYQIIRRSTGLVEPEAVVATVIVKTEDNQITLMEKTQNVPAGGTIDVSVDDYLINGRNNITVRVRGVETGTVGSASYSIVALNLELTDTFNDSERRSWWIINSGTLAVSWTAKGAGTKYIDWYIDGTQLASDGQSYTDETASGTKNISISNLSPGKHTLQYYAYFLIGGTDKFYSQVLYRDFIVDTADPSTQLPQNYITILSAFSALANTSTTPVIIEGTGTQADPIIINGITQYEPTQILFGSYYKDQSANKNFTITFDGSTNGYSVSSGANRVYEYQMRPYHYGSLPMIFECSGQDMYFNINTSQSEFVIREITNGLDFNFSGSDGNNSSETPGQPGSWQYTNSTPQTFHGALNGFNWNEHSGWDNGRLVIPDGASFVVDDYKPFNRGNSINTTGFTFEIEFQTNRVLREDTPILDLRDANNRGLYITTSEVIYTSGNNIELSTKYKPEENIRIDIVINPETSGAQYGRLLMLYIDGILCGIAGYDQGDSFNTDAPLSIIGTPDATVVLKQIRCYVGALSPNDILNNYMLYRDTAEELIEVYNRNDIYVDPTAMTDISMDKLAERTPIIVITGKDDGDPVTAEHPDPLETLLGFGTDNKGTYVRMYQLKVINKDHPELNMVLQDLGMRCQGTSSMMYPIKNFRFYTQAEWNADPNKDKSDQTYNPKPPSEYCPDGHYKTRMWVGGENPIEDGIELENKNRLYAFKQGSQPVKCWCLKADYAESSSTHNTGIARLWNDALSRLTVNYEDIDSRYYLKPDTGTAGQKVKVCQTIAQKKAEEHNYSYDVRTTVDGFPISVFYQTHSNETLRFVGRYNWNNDKSTESVFGFKDIPGFDIDLEPGETNYGETMECWEVTEGDMPVNTFVDLSHWDENTHGWRESFEARYPDDHGEEAEVYRARKESTNPETGVFDPGGALWQVCKWINGTMGASHVVVDQSGHHYMAENDPVLMAEFKTNKWNHLDVYKMAAYYCYLMRFGAVDQVVKNAMFTTEDGQHWYYINYDNDTINGVDNSGKLRFGYDIDRQTPDPSGSGFCYAGHESVLWNNLEADDEFMEIVKLIDNALYDTNILTYSRVIDMFNIKQSAQWAERTHNEDYKYKYVGYPAQFTKLQGPRKSHRQWWLSNRFARMDAINGVGSYKSNMITVKPINNQPVRVGDGVTITSAAEGQIFGYSFGNAMKESDRTAPVGENIWFGFSVSDTYNVGAEMKFYNPVFMGKFDMSRISDIAGEIIFDRVNSESFDSTLTEVVLGDQNSHDNTYSALVLNGLDKVKYLEKFVMRHYTGISSIDLSQNEYLKYVDLRNCPNLVNISLPSAAPINTLYYPGNVENITLTNLAYLNTFGLDSYAAVKNITIHGCPNLTDDSGKNIVFNNWLPNKTTADANCVLDLDNVNWTAVTNTQINRIIEFVDNGGTLHLLGKMRLQDRITDSALAHKLESIFGGVNVWDSHSAFYIDVDPALIIEGDDIIYEGDSYTYTTYYIGYEGYTPTGTKSWIFDTPLVDRRAGTDLNGSTGELTTTENGLPNGSVIIRCNQYSDGLHQTINGTKTITIRKRVYPQNDLSDVTINGDNNVVQGTNGFTLDFASNITGAMTATWEKTGPLAPWITLTPQGPDGIRGCVVTMAENPSGIPEEDYLVVPGTLQVTLRYKNGTTDHPAGSVIGDQGIKSLTIGYKDPSIALSTATNPAAMTAMQKIEQFREKSYLTVEEVGGINEIMLQPGVSQANSVFYSSAFRTQCKTFNEFQLYTGLGYIPVYLFYGCTGLEEITLPSSIETIKSFAFSGCTHLKSIFIPRNVKVIENNAFYGCSALESVIFEEGTAITTIGNYAFQGCTHLTNFVIPEVPTLTAIPYYCFYGCTALSSIVIPDNISSIGERAFSGCNNLESVTFGTGMRTINNYAFSNTKLIHLDIVDNITSVGYNAFGDCTSLIDARIGNGVTSVGASLFSGCSNLESMSVGDNVTTIPYNFCYNCTKLKTLHLGRRVNSFQTSSYTIYYQDGYLGGFGAQYRITITGYGTYDFSNNRAYENRYISSWGFWGCTNLETITIDAANSTYYDGRSGGGQNCILYKSGNANVLFAACKNSVIPSDCKVIGGGAFTGIKVTDVNIPASVTTINSGAFADCTTLETITIAENSSLTYIYSLAFTNCAKLRSFEVPEYTTTIGDFAFANNSQLSEFIMNNTVRSIGSYAFINDVSLPSFSIPKTVTSIGGYAFRGCLNITTFNIPADSGLTSIQQYTFYGCARLTSLTIPDSVTSIQTQVCRGCTSLHVLHIGKRVQSIATDAFRSYSGSEYLDLNGITVDHENEWYSDGSNNGGGNCLIYNGDHSLILGCKNTRWSSNMSAIADYAFAYVPGITSVEIPDGVSINDVGRYAFQGTGVVTVKLGNLVTQIGEGAFYGCTSLYKVDLGIATTSIGASAFYGCTILHDVAIRAEIPPLLTNSDVFSNTNLFGIWVDTAEIANAYMGASQWASYQNKIKYPIPDPFI